LRVWLKQLLRRAASRKRPQRCAKSLVFAGTRDANHDHAMIVVSRSSFDVEATPLLRRLAVSFALDFEMSN
jgi:hypothetical protein